MRILVDDLVARARPDLLDEASVLNPTILVQSFSWGLQFPEIVERFEEFQPEVMVLDPFSLVMAVLMLQMLNVHGFGLTRRVIATTRVSNVVKVRAKYHGFVDVLDLSSPLADLIERLAKVSNGHSPLSNDRIWTTVTRPSTVADIGRAPSDRHDLEILELICIGLSDKDIGAVTHMSHQSVRNRVSKMLKRSGIPNRTQLAWLFKEQKRVEALLLRSECMLAQDHQSFAVN